VEAILHISDISAPAAPRRAVRAQAGVVTQWLREQSTSTRVDAPPPTAPSPAELAPARERMRTARTHSRRGGRCPDVGAVARA